jgi:hypothetical protein
MIDFKYLTTVMHEFHVFGKNKENKEISLLKTLLKRKQRKDTSPNFGSILNLTEILTLT